MSTIKNIKGCIIRPLGDLSEDFKVKGLLLPKDEVSRNGILYDWDSVKAKAKAFEGVPMNYNHIIDDDKPPIGRIVKTTIKEEDDEEGKAGLYYEAEIDEESQYANSIKKKFLNKVSLQVTADAQKEEVDDDGNSYTRAWIRDPLEVSVVKVPGFNQTTMEVAMAEAFAKVNKEALRIGDKVHSPSGYAKVVGIKGNKITVRSNDPSGDFEYDKKDIQKESFKEDFGNFPMDKFHKGLKVEQEEHPELKACDAGQLVLDHFKEDPNYYNKEEEGVSTANIPSKTKMACKEFKVVDMIKILSDDEAKDLLESFKESRGIVFADNVIEDFARYMIRNSKNIPNDVMDKFEQFMKKGMNADR